MQKLSTGLIVALLGGALHVGCGSSNKSKSSTAATSATGQVSPQQRVEACKRIVANYKQYYLRGLRPGERAWVWLDSEPWRLHRAHIASIGQGISRV